jgi:hypothetical protein
MHLILFKNKQRNSNMQLRYFRSSLSNLHTHARSKMKYQNMGSPTESGRILREKEEGREDK